MEDTSNSVPHVILQQLGGQRFIAMTGAKSFAGGDRELSFRLSPNMTKGRSSLMRITLSKDDTYTLETMKVVRYEPVVLDTREQVHAGELRRAFTAMTGLDTSLGRTV